MKKLNLHEYAILSLYANNPYVEYAAVDAHRVLSKLVNKNTLHSQLSELWNKGLLSRRQEPSPPHDRPPKQLYRVTAQGVERQRELEAAWENFHRTILALDASSGSSVSLASGE